VYHNPYEGYAAAEQSEGGIPVALRTPLTLAAVGAALYLLFRSTLGADQPSRRRRNRRRR
jgi:hypothetical protein